MTYMSPYGDTTIETLNKSAYINRNGLDAEELDDVNRIAIFILRKLYNDRKIGGSHTAIENLPKGLPKHMGRYADKAIKYLFKERLIVPKSTGYGKHVSLNPRQIPKIEEMLGIEE